MVLLEDLHDDARAPAVAQQRRARVVEVRVGVVPGAHLLDGQVEDRRIEPLTRRDHLRAPGTHGAPRRRPRAARRVGSRVPSRCCSSCPGFASARESGCAGCRAIQPKISVEAATAPNVAAASAGGAQAQRRPLRGEVADRCSSGASGRSGASRTARAPSAARSRARRCRSRCAPRRGTRRARRRAARVRPARARAGSSAARAPAGRSDERRSRCSTTARAEHRAEHARALERQLRLGQRALELRAAARRPPRGAPGRAAAGSCTRAAWMALAPGDHLQLAVGGPDRARPGVRSVHEHAVAERHAAETNGLRHCAERSLSAACSRAVAGPGNCRRRPAAVEPTHRHHLADRGGGERLVRREKLVERERCPLGPSASRSSTNDRVTPGSTPGPSRGCVQDARRAATRCSRSRTRARARRSTSSTSSASTAAAGREGLGVARRLDAGEQRRRRRPRRTRASGRARAARRGRRAAPTTVATSVSLGPVEPQHVIGRRRRERRARPARAAPVGRRQRERGGRVREPLEVPVEQERPAAVDADASRTPRRRAAAPRRPPQKTGSAGSTRPRPATATASSVMPGTRPPTAASSGRALTHDSSISASGSESQTIPPPTQRWMRPSAIANVRIVSARSKSPFALDRPERPHRRAATDGLERARYGRAPRPSARR